MINKVLNEEWCISLALFTPTRSLFRAWLGRISSSYLLYVFRMKMHKIPFSPRRSHVTPHSWVFQSQLTLIQSLGLFLWGLNHPLTGMTETPTEKQAAAPRSLEHKVTACKSCTSVPCCGSLGLFLLPGNAAMAGRSPAAHPAWCSPARALKAAGDSLAVFALAKPCSSLPLPQLQLGPKQTLYGKVKSTAEAKPRRQIKAMVKGWGYRCFSGQKVLRRIRRLRRRNLMTWFPSPLGKWLLFFSVWKHAQRVLWQWPSYWAYVCYTSAHR